MCLNCSLSLSLSPSLSPLPPSPFPTSSPNPSPSPPPPSPPPSFSPSIAGVHHGATVDTLRWHATITTCVELLLLPATPISKLSSATETFCRALEGQAVTCVPGNCVHRYLQPLVYVNNTYEKLNIVNAYSNFIFDLYTSIKAHKMYVYMRTQLTEMFKKAR